jgi:hypothetical protein
VSSGVSSVATSTTNTTAAIVALPNATTSIVYTATDYVADPYQNSLNTFTLDVQLGSSNTSVPLLVSSSSWTSAETRSTRARIRCGRRLRIAKLAPLLK